jgi:hypothetical protein
MATIAEGVGAGVATEKAVDVEVLTGAVRVRRPVYIPVGVRAVAGPNRIAGVGVLPGTAASGP